MTTSKSKDGRRPGQNRSVEYEITDGHCVSPPGNLMENNLEEDRGDDGEN